MTKINLYFTEFDRGKNWVKGAVGEYYFIAKLFDEGSTYGIKGGRVSKLSVYDNRAGITGNFGFLYMIINYDRGWDIRVPRTKGMRAHFNALMKFLEAAPPLFEDELAWTAERVLNENQIRFCQQF